MTRVYALVDPRTEEVRYVGVTSQVLETRLVGHIYAQLHAPETPFGGWIRELQLDGLRPHITALEELPFLDGRREVLASEVRHYAEHRWIAHFLSRGARLTNIDGVLPRAWGATSVDQPANLDELQRMRDRCAAMLAELDAQLLERKRSDQ